MTREYLVTLRHTDPNRIPHRRTFRVRGSEQRAIIRASDAYRARFGAPKHGDAAGLRWVHVDFTVEDVARFFAVLATED